MIDYVINKIITSTIVLFFIWLFMLTIVTLFNILVIFGFIKTPQDAYLNQGDDSLIMTMINIMRTLLYPIFLYLALVTVILTYIFYIWLGIIYFVPYLIFVGFIPIPLKNPILEFVPPFKTLTDRGILPLLRRINTRLFEFLISGNNKKHTENINDLIDYTYIEIKNIFKDSFEKFFSALKYKFELIFEKPNIDNTLIIEDDIDSGDKALKEESKKIEDSNKNDEDKIRIMKLINEEIAICVANKSKMTTSDLTSSEALLQSQTNLANYADCYAKSINLYINNQI